MWAAILGYISLGSIVGGLASWKYVMWCVKKSQQIIKDNEGNYTEEEIAVIQNFVKGSLNKLK